MKTSLFSLITCALAASATPLQRRGKTSCDSDGKQAVPATFDGQCFYPVPTRSRAFSLDAYLGRWYQLAGTVAPFTRGCKCIYAEYSLNPNSTVNVQNGCQLNETEVNIQGTATPVDAELGYGESGVFRVQFPQSPPEECPGPNYIVQAYDGDDGWAIVQASNFSTLFILSREQEREESEIQEWIDKAGQLGSNLTEVVVTDQRNCLFT